MDLEIAPGLGSLKTSKIQHPGHRRSDHTTKFDLDTSRTCNVDSLSSVSDILLDFESQRVASVMKEKEGPSAGFLDAFGPESLGLAKVVLLTTYDNRKMHCHMRVNADSASDFHTNIVNERLLARVRNCRIKSVMIACPWNDTALSNGPRRGVMASMTTQRIFAD